MYVVLTHDTDQSTRDGGVKHLVELLAFVQSEWDRFEHSKRRTMRDITLPSYIEYLVLQGREYTLGDRRELWFRRTDKGYDPERFYVSSAIDARGHRYQLDFDLSKGSICDDEKLVRLRLLDRPAYASLPTSKGPLVRE